MRNSIKYLGGISALALAATGSAAQAQTVTAQDLANMKAQMEALQAQIDALEAQTDAQGAAVADAQARATSAEAKAAAASGPKISWKGAPEFEGEGGWSFKPRGRLQYDFAHFGEPDGYVGDDLAFNSELRRGRLGVQGDMPGGFGYKFEIDFAGSEVEFTDAFLTYEDGGLTLTAGQHNNFQSLSELTSSLDESFMERAAFTDAFNFERRVGLSAQYAAGDFLGQVGVFTANIGDLPDLDEEDNIGVSGRVVFMPKLGENTQLHLGASAHYRDFGDDPTSVRYRQRPMLHTTSVRFIDTGNLPADNETNYGLEAAVVSGRLHAAAEAHWQDAHIPIVDESTSFFGGYAEVGYFLTDNTRGYKGGVFKGPKVKNGVDNGGSGAIQLVARYDYLDLDDDDIGVFGGQQNAYEVGISWWPIDYVRLMANYGHIEYDYEFGGDFSTDVIGGRFQVSF